LQTQAAHRLRITFGGFLYAYRGSVTGTAAQSSAGSTGTNHDATLRRSNF
jgi:hypothetical protein